MNLLLPVIPKLTVVIASFVHSCLFPSSLGCCHLGSCVIQNGGAWKSWKEVASGDILWHPCELAAMHSGTMVCSRGSQTTPLWGTNSQTGYLILKLQILKQGFSKILNMTPQPGKLCPFKGIWFKPQTPWAPPSTTVVASGKWKNPPANSSSMFLGSLCCLGPSSTHLPWVSNSWGIWELRVYCLGMTALLL